MIMEAKSFLFLFVTLLLFSVTSPTIADFPSCYGTCYVGCLVGLTETKVAGLIDDIPKRFCPCAWKCLKQCLPHIPTINGDQQNKSVNYYCTLGCSMSDCENVQHDKDMFGGCVHNCSTKQCNKAQA